MDEREYNKRMEARRRVVLQRREDEKQKREFGFFAFLVIALAIAIVVVAIYILCFIREIVVKDNTYSTSTEVIEWLQEDMIISNSIITYIKFKFTDVELPAQIKEIDITLDTPWSLTVYVKDKEPVCGMIVNETYVYCDEEGMVLLESSSLKAEIPLVEGIEVDEYMLYEMLLVEDQDIFINVLEVTTILDETELEASSIICNEGASITIIIDEIEILLGEENYQDKIAQLEPILLQLEGQSGKLDLENFNTTNSTISFEIKNSEN